MSRSSFPIRPQSAVGFPSRYRRLRGQLAAGLAAPLTLLPNVAAAEGVWLQAVPGARFNGVSGDGRVAVGEYIESGNPLRPLTWTRSGGVSPLPYSTSGVNGFAANRASFDGSVVMSASGFVWRDGVYYNITDLGLPNQSNGSGGDITPDGKLLVGSHVGENWGTLRPLRVDITNPGSPGPFEYLGNFYPTRNAVARAVSADGSVVGIQAGWQGAPAAYLWSSGATYPLPGIPSGVAESWVSDISGDGQTVTGWLVRTDDSRSMYRWHAGSLTEIWPAQLNGTEVQCSADGSVVVGNAPGGPVYWTAALGGIALATFLHDEHGLDLSHWSGLSINGLSADGMTFVGVGLLDGVPTGFVASVPEPGVLLLVCVAMLRRPRRRTRGEHRGHAGG